MSDSCKKVMTPEEWGEWMPLTDEEKDRCKPYNLPCKGNYDPVVNARFLSYLKDTGVSQEARIGTANSASQIIHELFNYVRSLENCLVITTDLEHPNVVLETLSVKKHVVIKSNDPNAFRKELYKGYDCIFVYLIGTSYDGTVRLNYDWVRKLHSFLSEQAPRTVFVLDDVQTMFLPNQGQDYSLFDYIISTGHSLVLPVNMGLCVNCSPEKLFIGDVNGERLKWFLDALDVVLAREEKMRVFNQIIREYFKDYSEVKFIETNPYRAAFTLPKPQGKLRKIFREKFSDLGDVFICFSIIEDVNEQLRVMTRGYTYISGFPLSLAENLKNVKQFLDFLKVYNE